MNFATRIKKSIDDLQVNAEARILIGVSGGVDSMVLLHVLHTSGYTVTAAHVNFKLRGEESDGDEAHVRSWCNTHKIACLVLEADTKAIASTHGLNIQQAARRIRYQWWEGLIANGEFDYIATAHHQDDHIETVLMNFMRGTGLKGLLGIPLKRDKIIRPLHNVSRKEIEAYAKEHSLLYRHDSSNALDYYLRNNVRHQLIPLLENIVPGIKERIIHTATRSALEWTAWERMYREWLQRSLKIHELGVDIVFRPGDEGFMLRWLETQGLPWPLAHDYIMAAKQSGEPLRYMNLVLSRTKTGFHLQHAKDKYAPIEIHATGNFHGPNFEFSISLAPEGSIHFDELTQGDVNTEFVSASVIRFPLTLRTIRKGDFFQPLGMRGKSKKLQDLLVDRKLAMHEKEEVWVLANADHIVWVMGIQLDERAKIMPGVKDVYRLSVKRR